MYFNSIIHFAPTFCIYSQFSKVLLKLLLVESTSWLCCLFFLKMESNPLHQQIATMRQSFLDEVINFVQFSWDYIIYSSNSITLCLFFNTLMAKIFSDHRRKFSTINLFNWKVWLLKMILPLLRTQLICISKKPPK